MDGPESLETALAALVYRRSARIAFAAGGPASLGLGPKDAEALAGIDLAALEATAAAVRRLVLTRRHRGTGGLADWYPNTLAAWRDGHPEDADLDELAACFLDSSEGGAWRETAQDETGLSLEEAFFRFAESAEIGDAPAREREFFAAIVRAMAIEARPSFTLPASLRRAPDGWFLVTSAAPPILFAALGGRYIQGVISPLIEALLSGTDAEQVARQSGIPVDEVETAVAELVRLGLLGRAS